ncbi:hypothetical protein EDD17DRAFT_1899517 [Pisolithus thermaeus]|nr:hypothetical protein EDD17DRAFT_1899517 [Pisolithus thermaeus]
MYSRDDQFSYDGIPYHPSINPGWYDPSHRGSEVRYGPYHPQFILPPPFTPHRYPAHGYANDPTIHWPPGARGFGHHTNVPPPFHGAHETEYANAGGSCELPVRAYRQAQVYDSVPSDAGALLGTQSGLEHSAGTRQDAVLDSNRPTSWQRYCNYRRHVKRWLRGYGNQFHYIEENIHICEMSYYHDNIIVLRASSVTNDTCQSLSCKMGNATKMEKSSCDPGNTHISQEPRGDDRV